MKKLMIALAAAATTMFSFGDVTLPTGTSFEALTEGSVTVVDIVGKDDTGDQDGLYKYWYSTATETDELGAITNDVASGVSRPDMFADESSNTNSLQIDTTAPLVRTALPNTGVSNVTAVAIGDGIYLDTLVKFTAADEAFAEDLTGGDKIAIEYVEHEAEGDDVGYTNFVVRAGLIGEELGQTNYFAAVPADFNKDEWHRLTVRTIANVGDGNVGFVIYLDGDIDKTLEYPTTVDAGFGTLNATAQTFYNSEKHALFPSAVAAEDIGGSTISSVAFSGSGFIDDVSFAAEAPQFIKDGEAVVVTFVADAGVTDISVSVAGVTDPISVVNGSATLPAQTTAFTVNVTVDESNGYAFGSMTVGDTVYDTNPASVTGYAGDAITVTTVRNNFNLFDENGDPIQGTYQTLTEAFAAEGVAMIKLAYDYDALAFEGDDFDGYDIDGEIVLDLNGNDLDGGDDSAGMSLFRVADTLTIIDSVGGGSITYDTQYGYAIVQNDGSDAFIGAATGDAGATFNGTLFENGYEGNIVKGYIDDANNADEGVFLWDSYVDGGSDYELVDDYWVVTPQGVIGTYTVTVTPTANATYAAAYKVGGATITPANNVLTVTVGQTIVITATPAANYEYAETPDGWTAGQDGEITIEVSAAGTVAIPAPSVIEYVTLTITSVANCTIVVSNATAEVATGTQFNKADAVQLTVYRTPADGYVLDNCAATETITMDQDQTVTAAVKVSGGYPTYIEDLVDGEAKTAYEKKYDDWKATYGADTESAFGAAFLLNIDPAAADQTLEPVSITMEGGKVVISANQTLTAVNGKVYVKVATTLAGLATAEWTEATLNEGKVQVTPGSSDTAGFYKIKVDF